MVLSIVVSGFENGSEIPQKYTCVGSDISPEVNWDFEDERTRSFLLVMDDPDAPRGTFTHWIIYFPDTIIRNIPEDYKKHGDFKGYIEGRNDFGLTGYRGPCPPPGHGFHRYFFRLYGLNQALPIREESSSIEILTKIRGRITEQGTYMGRFKR